MSGENDFYYDEEKRKVTKMKTVVINFKMVILIIGVLAVGVGLTAYIARVKPELLGIDKTEAVQKEISSLVAEVGKIIALPEGETPTLATVTDVEKVKDQKFFENAQNGDKVLVYVESKKAYLYRPSEKKIIEVVTVNTANTDASSEEAPVEVSPTATPTPTVTIAPTASPTLTPAPSE